MKDPLVLLPGFMCDARLFLPQIIALSADTSIHVAPTGLSDSIEDMAKSILDVAPETFALAGHSLGAVIAVEIMRRAPDRVTRLALMDTNCQSEMPQVAAAREPRMVRVKSGRLVEVMREEIKAAYLAPDPNRPAVVSTAMTMAVELGPETYLRQSRAMQRRPDQQGSLRRSKTPTLVMCGQLDALCPVRRHEFIAQLMPNARLEVIPEAGHLPPLERPEIVTEHLRHWLSLPSGMV